MRIDQISKTQLNTHPLLAPFLISTDQKTITLKNGHVLRFDSLNNWNITSNKGGPNLTVSGPYLTPKGQQTPQKNLEPYSIIDIDSDTHLILKHKTIGDGTLSITDQLIVNQNQDALLLQNNREQKLLVQTLLLGNNLHLPQQGPLPKFTPYSRPIKTPAPQTKDPTYKRESLPTNYGKKSGESIEKKLDELTSILKKNLSYYKDKISQNWANSTKKDYYKDLYEAAKDDLKDLSQQRKQTTRIDKIDLYNRVSYEFELETTYNINLTSKGTEWSENDLMDLGDQLDNVSKKFTTNNANLHTIQVAKQKKGVGGYNTGTGFISMAPGQIDHAILHEIGHDFDNENPKWKEFLKLSSWKDVSNQFQSISSDYNKKNEYLPYSGTAKLKNNGKTYKDGDRVDLNGDGKIDGIIQVHYGKVMLVKESAKFITKYASSNPKDDFAETFKAFFYDINSAINLRKKCPEKFKFMVDMVGYNPITKHLRISLKI